MRTGTSVVLAASCLTMFASSLAAQDLGPHFRKIGDGIYVQSAREVNSTSSIVLTEEGPVIIDTGQTPVDAREVMEAVRKLTPLPVRIVINTEVHPDHTTGNFVFSPPALVINADGASEAMRKAYDSERANTLAKQSAEMRDAVQGYRLVTPHVEYRDTTTLRIGERTFELLHLKNVHSEADTAVWLPRERILFAASVAIPRSINNLRAFVSIPEMLRAIAMMKSLSPQVVVPGHGSFGTTTIFDDSERYYRLLLERVGTMVRAGRSLEQIKQELRMPEYAEWAYQERMPSNVEAAYRAVAGAHNGAAVIDAASKAMGTTSLHSIQYSGTGSVFMLGQAPRPGAAWPRFTVVKYVTAVNYDAPALREELVRTEVESPPRGGGAGGFNPATGQGGMRPILGEQTHIRQATPRTDIGQLQIWMTPHGFLKAAAANNASAVAATVGGTPVRTVSFTALGQYTVTGTLDDRNLVERVETRVDNAVIGDMLVEALYSGYRDFNGVTFPTRIVERQGGHPTLDVTISSVQPNGAATLEIRKGPSPAAPPAVTADARRIGDGVWDITAGGLHSVLVEFADHLVVIEASGGDARSQAVIGNVRRLVPNKPIRYLVNTHAHFDHAGGVRAFAAEGAIIITHDINKPFFETVFTYPHRINPDSLARSGRHAVIEGVGARRVLADATRTLELHHIRGNLHNDGLLMAYLPKEQLLIQADAFHPRPGAAPYPSPPQFTVNLFDNIQRLKLNVTQVLHIHGGTDPIAAIAKAAGRP